MKFKWLLLILISLIFLLLGFLTAGYMISHTDPRDRMIAIGQWHSPENVGSPDASSWEKAFISWHATFAVQSSEVLYLSVRRDETGAAFREECDYEMSGGKIPAHWWSVTIYNADGFLPESKAQNSIDGGVTNDSWKIRISRTKTDGGLWLPSKNAGEFNLLLRLYVPLKKLPDWKAEDLPLIRRVSCPA